MWVIWVGKQWFEGIYSSLGCNLWQSLKKRLNPDGFVSAVKCILFDQNLDYMTVKHWPSSLLIQIVCWCHLTDLDPFLLLSRVTSPCTRVNSTWTSPWVSSRTHMAVSIFIFYFCVCWCWILFSIADELPTNGFDLDAWPCSTDYHPPRLWIMWRGA